MYQYFFRIDTLELMVDIDAIKRRFESLLPTVDELGVCDRIASWYQAERELTANGVVHPMSSF